MSDAKPNVEIPEYKVINSRSLQEPDAEYRDNILYIIVHPDEKKDITVTTEEIQQKKAETNLSTERIIGALKLQKAGDRKFNQLLKENKLPTTPPRGDQPEVTTNKPGPSTIATTAEASQQPTVEQHTQDLANYYKDHFSIKEDGQCDIFITQKEIDRISLSPAEEERAIKTYTSRPSSQALRAYKQSAALAEKYHLLQKLKLIPKEISILSCTAKVFQIVSKLPVHVQQYAVDAYTKPDGRFIIRINAEEFKNLQLTDQQKKEAAAAFPHLSREKALIRYKRDLIGEHKYQLLKDYGLLEDPDDKQPLFYFTGTEPEEQSEEEEEEKISAHSNQSSRSSSPIMATIPASITRKLKALDGRVKAMQLKLDGNATTALTPEETTILSNKLDSATTEHSTLCDALYELDETIVITAVEQELQNLEMALDKAKIDCLKILTAQQELKEENKAHAARNRNNTVQLPKMQIPKFDGKWRHWLGFRDLFKTTILDKPDQELPPVQKMHFLKQSLEEEPLRTIRSIPLTGSNLDRAWSALCSKYNNTRKLTEDYLTELDNLKPITNPTASSFRKLLDKVQDAREALKVLGYDVTQWDPILVNKVIRCFDLTTRTFFEVGVTAKTGTQGNTQVTWAQLVEFIQMRAQTLDNANPSTSKPQHHHPRKEKSKGFHAKAQQQRENKCCFCGKNHWQTGCDKFKAESVDKRRELVKTHNLCFNCFSPRHKTIDCKSRFSCKTCGRRHHSLVHIDLKKDPEQTPSQPQVTSNYAMKNNSTVLLPTVRVLIKDRTGELIPYRGILDTGSQETFISEKAISFLNLKRSHCSINITGIGDSDSCQTRGTVLLNVYSDFDSTFNMKMKALILPKVTSITPATPIKITNFSQFSNLTLADPHFDKPSEIDLIIGADATWRILRNEKIETNPTEPIARLTAFGWVLSGNALETSNPRRITSNLAVSNKDLGNILQKFWTTEETVTLEKTRTKEEQQCDKIFLETTTRNPDGKLCVRIPFKKEKPELGSSYQMALKRLSGTEARLARNPELRKQYEQFLNEYEELGHMEEVQHDENANYVPHHPIVRSTVLTTKLRVVFDASMKTTNQRSLNDEQLVGPVIQPDLVSLLHRFRLYRVAIQGDISQMFRQIWIHPEHQDYQRILWRRKPEDQISSFKLKTITYGTASAPWLAQRSLQYIADQEQQNSPEAAEIIRSSMYMDDMIAGADSVEEATKLQEEVTKILGNYGLPLRKFASNEPYVIDSIKGDNKIDHLINPDLTTKTLGLVWDRQADTFSFTVNLKEQQVLTKRSLLAEVASIYDPLGLASPTIILAKILYQQIWLEGTGWDEPVPPAIKTKYEEFRATLPQLKEVKIPRWIKSSRQTPMELHAFSDASEKAYSTCVYLRVKSNNNYYCHLLAAKTRVAPLKTISIPRLELLGAVLLTKVLQHTKEALRIPDIPVFGYTDSTIVLAWIRSSPNKYKTFISNRIAAIQEVLAPENWFHVKTKNNPADSASRGVMPNELKGLKNWFHGPAFLQQEFTPTTTIVEEPQEERRKPKALHAQVEFNLIEKFNSYPRLLNFTSLINRSKVNFRRKKEGQPLLTGTFTVKEQTQAFHDLCAYAQKTAFRKEYNIFQELQRKEPTKDSEKLWEKIKKHKINNLDPFFDPSTALIRVGGRLRHSSLEYGQKHPILLQDGHFARLYLLHLHLQNLHAGPTLLLAIARQQVWIIGGKNAARQIVKNCNICLRWRGQPLNQKMGNLPAARLRGLRAFNTAGVDYAGPVLLKHKKGRGIPTHKGWISVFVCMTTKAVHLEAVTDMTSETFIACLRRFISRRGKPAEIWSDNGTNFVGADKELRNLFHQDNFQQQVKNVAREADITWKFIPAYAPHHGGLWEAAVKSTKYHLRRVLGESFLTYEELTTILCQIEAVLNSRPLCALNEDVTSPMALTPGHFLIGQPLTMASDPTLLGLKENRLGRWQLCQRMVQLFWKRFNEEYLSTLQKRSKWEAAEEDTKVGQLVIIKEENNPPGRWKMARITAVHPGSDGRVRVATLKTATGELQRPVTKLVLLSVDPLGQRGGVCSDLIKEEEEASNNNAAAAEACSSNNNNDDATI